MEKINRYIDHTLLKPETAKENIKRICEEAMQYNFMSVCVQPFWVKDAAAYLKDSKVKVCTVIGFPLGANTTEVKAFETREAISSGAEEVDMVINIGAMKSKEYEMVKEDIARVVDVAKNRALVKVIIETCLLNDAEKKIACELAKSAGADYVKTSTGFSTGGAVPEDVQLMREIVGEKFGVKASGGIKTEKDAENFIKAGANRLGTSNGIAIISKSSSETKPY